MTTFLVVVIVVLVALLSVVGTLLVLTLVRIKSMNDDVDKIVDKANKNRFQATHMEVAAMGLLSELTRDGPKGIYDERLAEIRAECERKTAEAMGELEADS